MLRRMLKASVAVLFLSGSLAGTEAAHASSVYDNNYSTSASAVVSVSGYCSETDISSNPFKYVLDPATWYNPSDATDSTSVMYQLRESLIAAFNDANNGSWGVSQGTNEDGTFKDVTLFWSDQDGAYLDWTTQEYTDSVLYKGNSGSYVHTVNVTCKSRYIGGPNDVLIAMPSTYNVLSAFVSSGSYGISNFYIYNANNNYPDNHENTYIQSGAPVIPISGTIQCFNGPNPVVSRVRVIPNVGTAGNAIVGYDGSGGYSYSYYVSEPAASYEMQIDCGGVTMYTEPSDTSVVSYIWYCSEAVSSTCYLD